MAQLPELMTTAEVAEVTRLSEETIRRWAREGRLKTAPMPGRIKRFRRADVDAILNGEQPQAAAS